MTSSFSGRRILLTVGIFLLAAVSFARGQVSSTDTVAPAFTLTTLDGSAVSLANYKGKVVLLDFWATWCVPCQTEVPRFVAFQNTYREQGFQVIGVSMDDAPEPVRKFYAKFKMNYPVAMGTEKVADSYGGVLGLPLTFLIGSNGRIIKQYGGSADLGQMEADIQKVMKEANKVN